MELTISSIKETCLYVTDLERTKAFYHKKLGLPVIGFAEGRHVFFRAGTSVLLCFNPDDARQKTHLPPHYGSGNLHFAFEVSAEQYEAWKLKIEGLEIEIEQEVVWREEIKSFYFRDPDNHAVEIAMPGIWER
ncbi:MAG: VOC family protein [Chitinophagales bacterium]